MCRNKGEGYRGSRRGPEIPSSPSEFWAARGHPRPPARSEGLSPSALASLSEHWSFCMRTENVHVSSLFGTTAPRAYVFSFITITPSHRYCNALHFTNWETGSGKLGDCLSEEGGENIKIQAQPILDLSSSSHSLLSLFVLALKTTFTEFSFRTRHWSIHARGTQQFTEQETPLLWSLHGSGKTQTIK